MCLLVGMEEVINKILAAVVAQRVSEASRFEEGASEIRFGTRGMIVVRARAQRARTALQSPICNGCTQLMSDMSSTCRISFHRERQPQASTKHC